MGGVVIRALPWIGSALGFGFGIKAAGEAVGEGLSDGMRNALTIAAVGGVAYVLWVRK